jgi:hypothetical protein
MVMPRFSFTIRLMRFAGTQIACARPDPFILQIFEQDSARLNRWQLLFSGH